MEKEIKALCKLAIDNRNRPLLDAEKELAKKAIEESKSIEELVLIALAIAQIS